MFNKRRSEIQIIREILDLSKTGAKKTEILYQNNMSFVQLKNYLSFLIEKKIIMENIIPTDTGYPNRIYVNTKKGNALLADINNLYSYLK